MKKLLCALFLCAAFFSYAQSRDDIKIYIPTPLGGTASQQAFFQEQFSAEVEAASYAVTTDAKQADYTIKLEIKPNMIVWEDANGVQTEEPAQEGGEDPLHVVHLSLENNASGEEIVSFEYPFTDVEEMYEWNLYLIYQAMANVPLTKSIGVVDDDRWRNKWLYLRISFAFSFQVYEMIPDRKNTEYKTINGVTDDYDVDRVLRETPFSPAGTLGLELHFLNWMSAEADIKFLFGDPEGTALVPTVGGYLKFVFKLSKHFMLEPYFGLDFPMFTQAYMKEKPLLGVGGGMQFGVKGGNTGAFFIDIGGNYNLGEMHTSKTRSRDVWWNRWVLEFGIGYKVGFVDRHPPPEK